MAAKTITLFVIFFIVSAWTQETPSWPRVEQTHKPWTRWWWHGSAVDSTEILRHLELFKDAGIGGVEVTSIYGVKGQEEKSVSYLSNDYIDILNFTADHAAALDIGVDIPPGSGWRCGGLGLEKEFADATLLVTIDTVSAGDSYVKTFEQKPQAFKAFSDQGERIDLLPTVQDKKISWQPKAGIWTVYHVTQKWSGANVKRPAPGGEGFSFNPYSLESTNRMLQPFSAAFDNLHKDKFRSIFHDSFEYSGDWMPDFFQEFENRRGYDLSDYLPELMGRGDHEAIRRVKSDYRETVSDLVLHNFILPLKKWSNDRGWLLRNQSHGSPANLLDLYGAVDIPETEIFRFDHDPRVLKFASSAANVTGKTLVSAESFTWQAEHFTVTLDTMKRSADLLFASSINHIFFHGTAYSPQTAEWPGWVFYASSQINPQNPLWRHLPAFNHYITRCQSLLQNSKPDTDVLIYWPVFDLWANPDGLNQKFAVHHPQWITENSAGLVAEQLDALGLSYDFVSDAQLQLAEVHDGYISMSTSRWKTIFVPDCEYIPLKTFQSLVDLAGKGATIIFENDLPANVPGLSNWQTQEKMLSEMIVSLPVDSEKIASVGDGQIRVAANVGKALGQLDLHGESLSQFENMLWIRKKEQDGFVYFLSNQSKNEIETWVELGKPFQSAVFFDPMTDKITSAQTRERSIYLDLLAGQSIFIKTFDKLVSGPEKVYWKPTNETTLLSGEWHVDFVEGGPSLPQSFKVDELQSWTTNGDPMTASFAGTARYTIQFDAPADCSFYQLNLGRVAESAQVILNGKNVGTLFAFPYSLDVQLLEKNNRLEIYVTNLPANRIRDLDRRGVEWRIFHDINFVNIDYLPFDASDWPIRESGLIGPVTLRPLTKLEF
jgi:hypothetical protein